MNVNHIIDVTRRTDAAAITALCTFNESVSVGLIQVDPEQTRFVLRAPSLKQPREFATASGAVEVLRRMARNLS